MSIRKLLLVLLVIPAAVSAQNYMDNPMVRIAMDTYAAQIQENPDDYMPDHTAVSRLVFDASFGATIPNYKTKYSKPAKLVPIYYMDTLAGVNFQPTEYVDISEEIDLKIRMLECHESQLVWMREHDGIDFADMVRT